MTVTPGIHPIDEAALAAALQDAGLCSDGECFRQLLREIAAVRARAIGWDAAHGGRLRVTNVFGVRPALVALSVSSSRAARVLRAYKAAVRPRPDPDRPLCRPSGPSPASAR